MKVAFNARYLYDPNLRGLNRYTLSLLRALEEIPGVETWLLSEERYPVHERFRSLLRARVTNLPAKRTLVWEQCVLPRHLRQLKPDVFHAPADGGLPLRKQCPYVLTLHGVPRFSLAESVKAGELGGRVGDYLDDGGDAPLSKVAAIRSGIMQRIHLHAADAVITVSEFSKRELVQFCALSPEKIRVVHEGAAEVFSRALKPEYITSVREKHRIPKRFVLFVGGFDKRKNVSTLLEAFDGLRRRVVDVALVLVGIGGRVEDSKRQAATEGLVEGNDVFYLQSIPDEELAALYRAAALCTTLSWHEGFCLPVVEAMSCGAPVLASSFGAIPEIVDRGGWLVDPRRVQDVVEAMHAILCQPDLRADLSARALSRAKHFSWSRSAQETLKVYEELCVHSG